MDSGRLITTAFPYAFSTFCSVQTTAILSYNIWNTHNGSLDYYQLFHTIDTVTLSNFSCMDKLRMWLAIGY